MGEECLRCGEIHSIKGCGDSPALVMDKLEAHWVNLRASGFATGQSSEIGRYGESSWHTSSLKQG